MTSILLARHSEITLDIDNIKFCLLIEKDKNCDVPERPRSTMHSHISTELFVCKGGDMTLKIENDSLVLRDGDAAIIPPGVRHFMSEVSPAASYYALSFWCRRKKSGGSGDLYKQLSPFTVEKDIIYFKNQRELYYDVELISREFEKNKLLAAIRVLELLIKMTGLPSSRIACDFDEHSIGAPQNDIQRTMKLDQLINAFFIYELRTEDVARQLYISTRQLDRIVKKIYGKSLHSVITDKRISAAEQLLITGNEDIDKICTDVGFNSKSGFYREFSKRYGMTPSKYRLMKQQISKGE